MKRITTIIIILSCFSAFAGEDYLIYKKGKKAWSGENWALASQFFQVVVDEYPESNFFKNSLYFLGNCSFKQRRYEEAFDHLSQYLGVLNGQPSAYKNAESMRLKSAYELAKTKKSMKRVLFDTLEYENIEMVLLSASLLLKLDERDIFSPLFEHLEKRVPVRLQNKLINFIAEHGSIEDRKKLSPYTQIKKTKKDNERKMLHLVIHEANEEVINICIPMTFAEYFGDILSETQLGLIEKEAKIELATIIERAKALSRGEILIQIKSEKGDCIKLTVD